MATQTFEMQAITVSQSQQDQQQTSSTTTLQPQTIIAQPQQAQSLQPAQQFVQVASEFSFVFKYLY